MYKVDTLFSLVDMPGYGLNMPSYFIECVEEYLRKRKQFVFLDYRCRIIA